MNVATIPARVMEVAPEDETELLIAANHAREKIASQRLREAQSLEPVYARRARKRQLAGGTSATIDAEVGRTTDLLAAAVGLGSGKQLERLAEVANQRPELLEAVDAGRRSDFAAGSVRLPGRTSTLSRLTHPALQKWTTSP